MLKRVCRIVALAWGGCAVVGGISSGNVPAAVVGLIVVMAAA